MQVCSIVDKVIIRQNGVIVKYMEEKPETRSSLMDDANAHVPVSAPISDSAPTSTAAEKVVFFKRENDAAHYCEPIR